MRRLCVICVLMITLLPLTSCGGKGTAQPMERVLAARGTYLAANGCTAHVTVTADYGQRVYEYGLDVSVNGQDTVLTVCQPTELAGITASLRAGESTLQYEDAILETGPLAQDGLTPLSAVAALFEAMRTGFIDSCGTEGELLYMCCRDPAEQVGSGRQIALWLHPTDHRLLRGEVSVDGRRVVVCEFETFALI